MEQEIRFIDFEGRRLAYATYGEGPPMVIGPRWVSHLEEEWSDPIQRTFYAELGKTHRVIRFDRVGCGLSSRELEPRPTNEAESRQLEAVIDAVGGSAVVFSASCSRLAVSQLAAPPPFPGEGRIYIPRRASLHPVPRAMHHADLPFRRV